MTVNKFIRKLLNLKGLMVNSRKEQNNVAGLSVIVPAYNEESGIA